jgi:putative restriction endonuclease
MDGSTKVVQPIWDEFNQNREKLISMSEEILASRENTTLESKYNDILFDLKDIKGVDKDRLVKTRINQSYFRRKILSNYVDKCAITGIDISELLFASHIIPWPQNEKERLNPENEICLSALYDKAFDKGLIGINIDKKIILAPKLKNYATKEYYQQQFKSVEGQTLTAPTKYHPKQEFLEFHLDTILIKVDSRNILRNQCFRNILF